MQFMTDDIDHQIDEGFEDFTEGDDCLEQALISGGDASEDPLTVAPPSQSDSESDEGEKVRFGCNCAILCFPLHV